MGSQQGHRKGINLSRLKMDIATKARGRKKIKKIIRKEKIKLKPIYRSVSQTELYSDFLYILDYVELIFLAIKLFFKETNCQKLLLIIQYSLATAE